MFVMYGIKNCDTIKKARTHLTQLNIDHQFHDYRVEGLAGELIDDMIQALSWQALLNTRGTTFRGLPQEAKTDITADKARALMLAHPALIKRPVLKTPTGWYLGYKAADYDTLAR